MINNTPEIKLGIVAVSRDCFPNSLSENRRKAVVKAYDGEIYECPIIVENEIDMMNALEDLKKAECDALVVYLGNFGPETEETLLVKYFDGPCMVVAAAEETGDDLVGGRGDAYCGVLNASYNLKLRNLHAYIPEYPVGDAEDVAAMIKDFVPVATAVVAVKNLKIISFGPRPTNFLACNAPIKQLYNLGVEIEENSELDLFEAFNKHAGDERIPAVVEDMAKDLGVSKYVLSRVFSKTFHRNFNQYLNDARLGYAKQRLENTNDPITTICLDSGYESQRTFNRVFKEKYMVSPSEYRKKLLL